MTSSISFGNLGTIDGKTVLTGGQSGYDTQALIDSLAKTKRLPAVSLETKITANKSKVSALGEWETKLKTLRDSLNKLRRPSGLSASTTDVFASRLAYLTASDGTTASNYVGITAANGAAIKNYNVTVTNLAVAESRKSLAFTSRSASVVNASGDETAGRFSAGTFAINGQSITLDEGDNLNNIAAKINAKKGSTNVEASILQISDSDFRLIISSTKTGTDNAIAITDAVDNVFVGGSAASIFTSVTAAENATFTIDNVAITRQTNTISDAVDGVTFSLYQETDELASTPTVRVEIGKNTQAISEAIVGFVDAYNAARVYYGSQIEKDSEGGYVDAAVLHGNPLFETLNDSIVNSVSGVSSIANPFSVDDGTTSPINLADLGITLADYDGDSVNGLAATTSILEVDATKLTSKIDSYFEDVQKIFGFDSASTSSDLNLFSRGTVSSSEAFTILIDNTQVGQEAKITHIDGYQLATPVTLTYSTSAPGYTAVISGTGAFAGLEFYYSGDGTSTEIFNASLNNGQKDYTMAVNGTADTAAITHIHGAQLSSAISLNYTASTTGATISGPEGTPLADMVYVYTSSGSESIDISFSQGFADKLFLALDIAIDGTDTDITGAIEDEVSSLNDSSTSLQESIDKIDTRVNEYTQQLLQKFAALEAALSASNSTLQLLTAQTNAQNNSSN